MAEEHEDDTVRWRCTSAHPALDRKERGFKRMDGHVSTPHGIVVVYTITAGIIGVGTGRRWTKGPITRFHVIVDGEEYVRSVERDYTDRAAALAARRFAREAASGALRSAPRF